MGDSDEKLAEGIKMLAVSMAPSAKRTILGDLIAVSSSISSTFTSKFYDLFILFESLEVQLTRGRSYGQSHCLEIACCLDYYCNPCSTYLGGLL